MSIGIKGHVYRGWIARYDWNAVKGYNEYTVKNPDRPDVVGTFTRQSEAERWIDKQANVKPVDRAEHRNQYGQKCARCGGWVRAGAGLILTWEEAERQGMRLPIRPGYIVVHVQCPQPQPGLAAQDPWSDAAWVKMQENQWAQRPAPETEVSE